MANNQTYIVYDIRKVGDRVRDWEEIIEIGAYKIRFEDVKTKILGEFHTYIHPIGHEINQFSDKEYEELQKAPNFNEAIHEFIQWADKKSVFVSWDSDEGVAILNDCERNWINNFPRLKMMSLSEEYLRFSGRRRSVGLFQALLDLELPLYGPRTSPMAKSYNMIGVMQAMWNKNSEIHSDIVNEEQIIEGSYKEIESAPQKTQIPQQEPRHARKDSYFKNYKQGDALRRLREDRDKRRYSYCFQG